MTTVPKTTTRLLAVAVVVASVLYIAGPAAGRVVIRARAKTWSAGGHIFATLGEKVVWRNPTSGPHDIKSYNQGKRWRLERTQLKTNSRNQVMRRFETRGNYYFRCALHSFRNDDGKWEGMVGIVHARP